jgi:hypothetical protein
MVSFTPQPLYHRRKNRRYRLDRRLVGSQSRSERHREEKNSPLPGTEPRPSCPYPVATPAIQTHHNCSAVVGLIFCIKQISSERILTAVKILKHYKWDCCIRWITLNWRVKMLRFSQQWLWRVTFSWSLKMEAVRSFYNSTTFAF